MLKKRIIGVIAVENNWAVQSIGYGRTLPLGRPEWLAENLDRWGADEIMILDFARSRRGLGPNMELIGRLNALGLMTPLSYGGGIATVEQAISVVQAGVERVCVDSLLHDNPTMVVSIAHQIGSQAIVGAFPLRIHNNALQWYDHRHNSEVSFNPLAFDLLAEGYISEALLVDWQHEGIAGGFNPKLIEMFLSLVSHTPLLLYGGISEPRQIGAFLSYPAVSAVCVGNFLNYKEHALQILKEALAEFPVRPPSYATGESYDR